MHQPLTIWTSPYVTNGVTLSIWPVHTTVKSPPTL